MRSVSHCSSAATATLSVRLRLLGSDVVGEKTGRIQRAFSKEERHLHDEIIEKKKGRECRV